MQKYTLTFDVKSHASAYAYKYENIKIENINLCVCGQCKWKMIILKNL